MDGSAQILSDVVLWEKFLAGDDACITIVYKRYANELYSYGLKIVNDESLVKDCIQDVFINLIDKKRKLLIGSHIYLYLFKSLRNRLLDEVRSASRKHEILNSDESFKENVFSDSAEISIIQEEESLQIRKEIDDVLNSLTGKQKEIIYLKYSKGLSYDEIAMLLDVDKASARTLLYRTLKTVKEKLGKKLLVLFVLFNPFLK